jgi:single-strand DNA-binding protein
LHGILVVAAAVRKPILQGEQMTYHSIILVGNATKDPEMRYMPNGDPISTFSVAVNEGSGDKKYVIWIKVVSFGKLAEIANEYVKKGGKVLVQGALSPDKSTGNPPIWTGQDGVAHASYEVVARVIRSLSSSGGKQEKTEEQQFPF